MIDLRLGDYRIYTLDDKNIVLSKYTTVTKPSAKNLGEIAERRLGYHSSLKSAIKSYMEREMASEAYCINTVEQLQDAISRMETIIEQAAEQEAEHG